MITDPARGTVIYANTITRTKMRTDCFGYIGRWEEPEEDIIVLKERCFALTTKDCQGCRFYKPRTTVKRHEFYIHQTQIVEWIDEH